MVIRAEADFVRDRSLGQKRSRGSILDAAPGAIKPGSHTSETRDQIVEQWCRYFSPPPDAEELHCPDYASRSQRSRIG